MQSIYEIPTGPSPRRMTINPGSGIYNLRLAYAETDMGGWFMDIADASNNAILCGVPLVPGVDLLAQYAYLGIGGRMFVATEGDLYATPGFADLGVCSHLYFWPN